MKHRLMELKYWQITALAVAAVALVCIITTVAFMFIYPLTGDPSVTALLSVLQLTSYALAGWYVPTPFVDAYRAKKNQARIDEALERLIEAFRNVAK